MPYGTPSKAYTNSVPDQQSLYPRLFQVNATRGVPERSAAGGQSGLQQACLFFVQ